MTIAMIVAYRRPFDMAAAIAVMAGIDAHVAAPCSSPVAAQVMSTMTIAGSRTRTSAAATKVSRRLIGIAAAFVAAALPATVALPGSGVVMLEP